MRKKSVFTFFAIATLLTSSVCFALVFIDDQGRWPNTWPKELERYRDQAQSLGVAHGIQEIVHEIRFHDRDDFERAWPYILKVKSKGAPITLEPTTSTYGVSGSTVEVGVRIICPSLGDGFSGSPEDKSPYAAFSWLSETSSQQFSQKLAKGVGLSQPNASQPTSGTKLLSPPPPAYVVYQNDKWVPFDGATHEGFRFRARTDITLVVDEKIIDPARIQFPPDTPVIDKRSKQPSPSVKTTPVVPEFSKHLKLGWIAHGMHCAYGKDGGKNAPLADEATIPEKYWSEEIRALKPIRVYTDLLNTVVVLREENGMEEGKYIIPVLSSYVPSVGKNGITALDHTKDGVFDFKRTKRRVEK